MHRKVTWMRASVDAVWRWEATQGGQPWRLRLGWSGAEKRQREYIVTHVINIIAKTRQDPSYLRTCSSPLSPICYSHSSRGLDGIGFKDILAWGRSASARSDFIHCQQEPNQVTTNWQFLLTCSGAEAFTSEDGEIEGGFLQKISFSDLVNCGLSGCVFLVSKKLPNFCRSVPNRSSALPLFESKSSHCVLGLGSWCFAVIKQEQGHVLAMTTSEQEPKSAICVIYRSTNLAWSADSSLSAESRYISTPFHLSARTHSYMETSFALPWSRHKFSFISTLIHFFQ